jgi:hypothetical protein
VDRAAPVAGDQSGRCSLGLLFTEGLAAYDDPSDDADTAGNGVNCVDLPLHHG